MDLHCIRRTICCHMSGPIPYAHMHFPFGHHLCIFCTYFGHIAAAPLRTPFLDATNPQYSLGKSSAPNHANCNPKSLINLVVFYDFSMPSAQKCSKTYGKAVRLSAFLDCIPRNRQPLDSHRKTMCFLTPWDSTPISLCAYFGHILGHILGIFWA